MNSMSASNNRRIGMRELRGMQPAMQNTACFSATPMGGDVSNPTSHNQLDDPSPRSKYTAASNYQPPTPMSQALPNCPSFNVKSRYQNQRSNKIPNLFSHQRHSLRDHNRREQQQDNMMQLPTHSFNTSVSNDVGFESASVTGAFSTNGEPVHKPVIQIIEDFRDKHRKMRARNGHNPHLGMLSQDAGNIQRAEDNQFTSENGRTFDSRFEIEGFSPKHGPQHASAQHDKAARNAPMSEYKSFHSMQQNLNRSMINGDVENYNMIKSDYEQATMQHDTFANQPQLNFLDQVNRSQTNQASMNHPAGCDFDNGSQYPQDHLSANVSYQSKNLEMI